MNITDQGFLMVGTVQIGSIVSIKSLVESPE